MRLSKSRRSATLGLTVVLLLSAPGCGVGYYTRTAWGGAKILVRRDSIDRLVRDPRTDEELRRRLLHVRQARDFASQELALPDNESYRNYSEVRNAGARSPYVVWNVVATPELSLEPLQWCFPVAGCVIYRGYFSEKRADRFGGSLRNSGHDVEIYGVRAYSTLGRFADPVLSTFLYGSDPTGVAGYLFHELAHQVAYVKGDTDFNESFATLVEEEGLRRWLESRGENDQMEPYITRRAHDEDFRTLVLAYRQRLSACYAQDRLDEWKRAEKARLIGQLRTDYETMMAGWAGDRRWDNWFDEEVNNADFALMASYYGLVPGFRRLLEQQGNDLPAFYEEVGRIAALGRAERQALLAAGRSDEPAQ